MRLELSVEGEEPRIYRFDKDKIIVGFGADCDIQITAEGISRKHLVVTAQNDSYYVVDQGSTNGSFINEERLIPGQRADFTSFFPVKLGPSVSLTLLSDEETRSTSLDFGEAAARPQSEPAATEASAPVKSAQRPAAQTFTATDRPAPSPKMDFSRAATTRARAKAEGTRAKVPAPSREKQRLRVTSGLVFGCLVLYFGYFFWERAQEERLRELTRLQEEQKAAAEKAQRQQEIEEKFARIANLDLRNKVPAVGQGVEPYLGASRCGMELAALCEKLKLPVPDYPGTGLFVADDMLFLVLPALPLPALYEKYRAHFGWGAVEPAVLEKHTQVRDTVDLFLSVLSGTQLTPVLQDREWVVVVRVDQLNGVTYPVYFAKAAALKAVLDSAEFGAFFTRANGRWGELSKLFGGLFRSVPTS